jgi:hypothetical protein
VQHTPPADPALGVEPANAAPDAISRVLRRMRDRRPTSGGYALVIFLAFAVGGGVVGRTLAALAEADGLWFHLLRLVGVAVVFGAAYLGLPAGLTEHESRPGMGAADGTDESASRA